MVGFLKKLNIIILSVCLLNLTTHVAIAEVKKTEGALTTDASGNKSRSAEYQFDAIQQKSLISTITMLAAGVVLARAIISYKPMTNDIKAAAVGGAAFFGGEILSNMQLKKELDAISVKTEKGKDADVESQMKSFQDLKDGYLKVQKSLKTKKTLQLASAASFGTAGLLAAYMAFKSHSGLTSCKAALTKGMLAAKSCAGVPATSAECGKCSASLASMSSTISKYTTTKDIPADSAAKSKALLPIQEGVTSAVGLCTGAAATPIGQAAMAVCKPVFANEKLESSSSAIIPKVSQLNNYFDKTFMGLMAQLLLPTAHASWIPTIAGISGAILATFKTTAGMISKVIDPLMVTPKNRAIAWGIFAGMAYTASKSTDEVLKQIDERIKVIDEIMADLAKYESGIMSQTNKLDGSETGFIKTLGGGVNGIDTGSTYTTQCLDSNSTANCSSVSKNFEKTLLADANLPPGLKSLAGQLGKMGDGLGGASDISGSTLAAADGLAGKNAAIRKSLKTQIEKLNKLSGDDIPKLESDLEKKLNAQTLKSLQNRGFSPSSFISGMGGTPISAASEALAADEEKDNIQSLVAAVSPSIDTGNGKSKNTFEDFNFVGDSSPAIETANLEKEETGIYPGELPEDSIGKADGPSLFEILTSRYMKSGYPKLLEEDQN